MKAIVYEQYGSPDVLKLKEINKPQPEDNELLIKIHATTVTSGNCKLRSCQIPTLFWLPMRLWLGLIQPKRPILGSEFSGEVTEVGKNVRRFKKGDQVFGFTLFGTYAEYICLSDNSMISQKPKNVTYAEAASIPFGALTALYFLRLADIQVNQSVLIYGASGAVGSAAVQLAKEFGAKVTAVCSGKNMELVQSLGADKVIDYLQHDYSQTEDRYDIVFDAVGKASFNKSKRVLKPKSYYLMTDFGVKDMLLMVWTKMFSRKKVICAISPEEDRLPDLILIKSLIEGGHMKPVIDRHYSLEKIPEAHHYVEAGHKVGSVVITL